MTLRLRTILLTATLASLATAANAQDKLKVGMMATLSGPAAVIGQHMRDGFQLGMKQLGGKLGGLETELVIVDDELKPDVGIQKAQQLLERDKVDIVVGVIFSNVMMAIAKPVFDSKTPLISPNAGPSPRRTRATRRPSWSHRIIRPAGTRWPASSATTRARSSKRSSIR
jgi:branched-chain amino acid transport system substrate-binding protein